MRVGQNRPSVVRLVFDLKEEVRPQVFMLPPVGTYQHRLIFDLYPINPPDPIAALIAKGDWLKEMPKRTAAASSARRSAGRKASAEAAPRPSRRSRRREQPDDAAAQDSTA